MKRSFVILLVLSVLVSCTRDDGFSFKQYDNTSAAGSGTVNTPSDAENSSRVSQRRRNVTLIYSAGYNSLASDLDDDIRELHEGFVPENTNRGEHVLLVYSKLTRRSERGYCLEDYNTPTESALFRIYKESGEVVHDTLKVWGTDVDACNPQTLREVLQLTSELFPAKGYGMVFSSHATGWLPSGYYSDPSKYDRQYYDDTSFWISSSARRMPQTEFPPIIPYLPVKSLGQDNHPGNSVEIELDSFANAIPIHLDYLLIDACLSGCVEVAWQFRGKADVVGFSPTEVLTNGFNYKTIARHLVQNTPDPVQVCKDYFDYYDTYLETHPGDSEMRRSATISVVDTRKMDVLADVCKTLFEKYREQIKTLSGSRVQEYFQYNRHFFYDLKDVLLKAGITAEEEAALDAALSQCIIYKAATEKFISIKINTFSGFSMYLPSMGSDFLDGYYKAHIAWNKDTELVK